MKYALYNMGPIDEKVTDARARIELPAIMQAQPEVDVTGLVECLGRDLPEEHGQVLIRNRKNLSVDNIALYVSQRVNLGTRKWVMCEKTWPRVEHAGVHEARAILVQNLALDKKLITLLVSQAPQAPLSKMPRATRVALLDARQEWMHKIKDIVTTTPKSRQILIITDPNGLQDLLHGSFIGGKVVGGDGQAANSVRFDNLTGTFFGSARGVRLLSDHNGYLKGSAW